MTIYELFNANALAAYWETLHSNALPYLGATLFTNARMQGLKLDWVKGYDELPTMLMPSAFDAKPTIRDRGGVSTVSMRMPFFRESMRIGEEDRQQLLTLLAAGGTMASAIVQRLFNDADRLISGAEVNPEVMRFSAMQTGTITIASPDESGIMVNYSYDYDPKGQWKASNVVEASTKWSEANATIVADILAVKRAASAKGVMLTRAIVSPTMWARMLTNSAIATDVLPLATDASISDQELLQYLVKKTGIVFTVYEKMYKDLSGRDQAFMMDDRIVFLPTGTIGQTFFGTTPEEADLMTGNVDCDIRIVGGGIAVGSKKISLPVNSEVWASEIVLPSFQRMNAVYVLIAEPAEAGPVGPDSGTEPSA